MRTPACETLWWQLYPLGFTGAPIRTGDFTVTHRLPHLANWLDYCLDLGCTGLLLGPIFASATHGYDTVDHFRIDPRLGDDADFDALVAQLRDRGMALLLDGVFSHVARSFSADDDWFRTASNGERETFEGHHALVRLNHANPAVIDYTTRVMCHWLDRGIDGWRLDAAYAVPTTFWHATIEPTRRRFPHAWFLAEVIHGDYVGFQAASGVDSLTQYELWKAIWSSLKDRNLFELRWSLLRHREFSQHFPPNIFLGNHDVTRLASQCPEWISHAVALLCCIGGVISIYAGDEQGMVGVKEEREGGDDIIRPRFPDLPPPPGREDVWGDHRRLLAFRRERPWLTRAATDVLEVSNERMLISSTSDNQRVWLALNLTDQPWAPQVPGTTCLTSGAASSGDVPARGWAIYE